jgi:hypothetical protein
MLFNCKPLGGFNSLSPLPSAAFANSRDGKSSNNFLDSALN